MFDPRNINFETASEVEKQMGRDCDAICERGSCYCKWQEQCAVYREGKQ
jgi:hypothetical protein